MADTSNVFVDDQEIYYQKTKAVPKPKVNKDIDTDGTLFDNIIEAGLSSQLDISSISALNQKAENRNQMYNIFDCMCDDGTISAVIETYAEDSTERNDNGRIVWAESPDANVLSMVDSLLYSLNVDKNIYKWCHSLCKYGDVYLRLYRESEFYDELFNKPEDDKKQLNEDINIKAYAKSDKYAQYMEMVQNPATMFELTKFGKSVGYIKAPVTNTIVRNENTSLNTFTFSYRFKKNDIDIYPATEFVHASLENNSSREEEVVDIFMNEADYDSGDNSHSYKVRKGQSILANVYKIWRELQLLENSVLLNRLTKSAIVRLVNVEVGDMPKENVAKVLMGVKQMVEQKSALKEGQSLNEYTNSGPIENNVYVPTHEGVGQITTSQIGGDVDVKSLIDLDYFMNKLYGQLRVPKQYFSQTDDSTGFNGGTSLSIISSRYAKMIKRVQNSMLQAITDAINLFLIEKGLDGYVNKFKLHMLPPTTQEEIDRRDNLSGEIQLVTDVMGLLADIENPITKLKILKSLLSNVVNNPDVMDILQDEITAQEEEVASMNEETVEEETSEEEMGGSGMPGGSFGGGMSDIGEDPAMDDLPLSGETEEEESEDILPSPSDLDIDMTDSDEE